MIPQVHGQGVRPGQYIRSAATRLVLLFLQLPLGPIHAVGIEPPAHGLDATVRGERAVAQRVAFGVDDAPLQLIFSVRFGRIRVDVKLHLCTAAVVGSTPVVIGRETSACVAPEIHIVGIRNRENTQAFLHQAVALCCEGTQWCQVINHVGRSAKRAQNQVPVPWMDDHVTHRDRRHIVFPTFPIRAPVEADEEPFLRSQEQQRGHLGVLDDAQHMAGHLPAFEDQPHPRFPAIGGAVQVRLPIVAAVIVDHDVHLIGIVGAHVNLRDPRPLGEPLDALRVVCPCRASIGRMLDAAIIGTDPNFSFTQGVGRNAQDGAVVLSLGRINGQSAGLRLVLLFGVVGREVGTLDSPRVSAVGAVVHELGAEVHAVRVERIGRNGRVPCKPQSSGVVRHRLNRRAVAIAQVDAREAAALVHGVCRIQVFRCGQHIEAVSK